MKLLRHKTVYANCDYFSGWPANHSAYSWGDELLVGFVRGKYNPTSRMHKVSGVLDFMQARSLDGGKTWSVEKTPIKDVLRESDLVDAQPHADGDIYRIRGSYDHGGDYVPTRGAYYKSSDRGKTWNGPFDLGVKLNNDGVCTSRTSIASGRMFYTVASAGKFGSDYTLMCDVSDIGSMHTNKVVWKDQFRAAMPSVVYVNGTYVVALRRKDTREKRCWIDCVSSSDGGNTWTMLGMVGDTGSRNGNPPALAYHNGKLVCAYANRKRRELIVRVSGDLGKTWGDEYAIRRSMEADIGYPQLLVNKSGEFVCAYYWADDNKVNRIESTTFFA